MARGLNARSVWMEMRHGHFSRKRWVRPCDAARYFGAPLKAAEECLRRLACRGEVEAAPDNLDRRKRKYWLVKSGGERDY